MHLDLKRHGRPRLLAYLLLGVMVVFICQLFYLQIIRHGYYVSQADQEQIKQLVIPAQRGEIYALDDGKPVTLVLNQTVYTVFADPAMVTKPSAVVAMVKRIAGGNARPHLDDLVRAEGSRYEILATHVTRSQAEKMKALDLAGVGFQKGTDRVYPEGSLAAQVLGFVDDSGHGRYGIEGAMNKQLAGTNGLLQSVTDIRNVPLTIGDKNINIPAKDGENVVLTIDRNIQAYTEQALRAGLKKSGATNGSVIVMDPQNGKIMAMANLPTYNPATYYDTTDPADFNNDTISLPYEPGSDVKTLTMTAGIDTGVAHAGTTYVNTDHVRVKDWTIGNATLGQTGTITFQHALNYSLNTGFVTVEELLGGVASTPGRADINYKARQTLYDYFHNRLRLGELTGVQLAGESAGTVVPPSRVDTGDGGSVRYSNMAFGQGLDVTMLQMSAAFSAIINGGTYYTPSIVDGTVDSDGQNLKPIATRPVYPHVVKASTSNEIRTMIHDARDAFYAGKDKPGYYIGGKTGTSQALVNGTYSNTQTIGTYLGYGGATGDAKGPKYVIMVRVSGKGMNLAGNTDAMPIFTDISNWMLGYLKLEPKG